MKLKTSQMFQQKSTSYLCAILSMFFLCFPIVSQALIFNITPNGPLPTSVPAGSTVMASYKVMNNTVSQRNNNFVKYLPPNVSIASGGCADNFNLAPKGRVGDSCNLNLTVRGAVNSADSDPHHHLFVCFPGGTSCAGTKFPLNVKVGPPLPPKLLSIVVTPSNTSIQRGDTQQFKATGNFSDASSRDVTSLVTWSSSNISAATIAATGLATGVGMGSTTIRATLTGISGTTNLTVTVPPPPTLLSIVVTPANPSIQRGMMQQFMATGNYSDGTSQDITSAVTWTSADISIATIASTGLATGVAMGISTITATQGSISGSTELTVNPRLAYVSNFSANTISVCSIDPTTGKLILCQDSGVGAIFSTPIDISLNPSNTRLYVGNFDNTAGTIVQSCNVNATTGKLSGCANVDGDGSAVFNGPSHVAFNALGTKAYVSNLPTGIISLCSVNPTTGKFTACAPAGSGFSFPVELKLTTNFTRAYVGNDAVSTTISLCSVNTSTGALTGCANAAGDSSATFFGPAFMAFNNDETLLYVGNNNSGTGTTVSLCSVNTITGKLSNCTDSGAGPIFNSPGSINLNPANTLLYIGNQAGTTVTLCTANVITGLLSACNNAAGDGTAVFSGPAGIILY